MNRIEKAVSCFNEGFSCSQAILSSYGVVFGMTRNTCLKIATGFGAGIARQAETCGAVAGAIMVIGLKHGRTRVEDEASRDSTYERAQQFISRFKARNGSITCKELLGHDISTEGGLQAAEEEALFTEFCPKLVRNAAEILENIL
jgi:C_GCAxxG_C_C family probable redox protein